MIPQPEINDALDWAEQSYHKSYLITSQAVNDNWTIAVVRKNGSLGWSF